MGYSLKGFSKSCYNRSPGCLLGFESILAPAVTNMTINGGTTTLGLIIILIHAYCFFFQYIFLSFFFFTRSSYSFVCTHTHTLLLHFCLLLFAIVSYNQCVFVCVVYGKENEALENETNRHMLIDIPGKKTRNILLVWTTVDETSRFFQLLVRTIRSLLAWITFSPNKLILVLNNRYLNHGKLNKVTEILKNSIEDMRSLARSLQQILRLVLFSNPRPRRQIHYFRPTLSSGSWVFFLPFLSDKSRDEN